MKLVNLLAILALSCFYHCDLDSDLGNTAGVRYTKIIDGDPTDERPEVGVLYPSGCTATLIAPNVVLTAAHCINYAEWEKASFPLAGPYTGSFAIGAKIGEEKNSYPALLYRSWGRSVGASDLALVLLKESVPSAVATPISLAKSFPPYGSSVTAYGFGCNSHDEEKVKSTYGTKRKYTFIYSGGTTVGKGCPGDSGGPYVGDTGIYYVFSAANINTPDWTGNVVKYYQELEAQRIKWDPARCVMTDAQSCNSSPECTWVHCHNRCTFKGVLLKDICPALCLAQTTLEECNKHKCGWFHCTQSCWPKGTELSVGCDAKRVANTPKQLCANNCFQTYSGHATNLPELASFCATDGNYASGVELSSTPTCWRCNPKTSTNAGFTHASTEKGWVGGNPLASCSAPIDMSPSCENGCYLTATYHATNKSEPGGACAEIGDYFSGTELIGIPTCWRCGKPTKSGSQMTAPGLEGNGWNGGSMQISCDSLIDQP